MTSNPPKPTAQPPSKFRGSRVLIVGLGRFGGGVAVSRWLADQGARLTITDLATAETLSQSLAQIANLNANLRLGGHEGIDPGEFDLAIVNPAVAKRRSDLFHRIEQANTPWTTEMNLFCERCPAKVVGVTGSYGKSTTCAMLATILEAAVRNKTAPYSVIRLGGNIGRSLLNDLDHIRPNDLVILEMSNAQLEDLPRIDWTPAIAAITNLWPHHLDRYESDHDYYNAKLNIARSPNTQTPLIVGDMHPRARALLGKLTANAPGQLHRVVEPDEPLDLSVPGKHNASNASTALAICKHLGIDAQFARAVLREFRGLPDRLERVPSDFGATFINDSKSTAPTATIVAVQAIRQSPEHAQDRLTVIVGGKAKDVELENFATQLARSCHLIICMGESGSHFAETIARAVKTQTAKEHARVQCVSALADAVAVAKEQAHEGDVVLFSPGAPSFDAYVNYAARGEHFRALVGAV